MKEATLIGAVRRRGGRVVRLGFALWVLCGGVALGQDTVPDSPAVPAPVEATTTSTVPVTQIGVLTVPKMNLRIGVFEGVTEAALTAGVGHYPNTPIPGRVGNAGIAGHRNVVSAAFGAITALAAGDEIFYLWEDGVTETRFVVESVQVLAADDPTILAADDTRTVVTLTAAEGDGAQQFVVRAVAPNVTAPVDQTVPTFPVVTGENPVDDVDGASQGPGGAGLFAGAIALSVGVALVFVALARR